MNKAIWLKSWREAQWLLLASCVLLFFFFWLQVWIIRQMTPEQLLRMLEQLPRFIRDLMPVPIEVLATERGRLAFAYDHPLVWLTVTVWAVARGSDVISGELGRGTLEMVIAQPVRRTTILLTHAAVTFAGALLLCLSGWLGTWVGLRVESFDNLAPLDFLPAAANLFTLAFFLSGITSLVSACDNYRWRTIAIVAVFYVFAIVTKLIARASDRWDELAYLSFFSAFEPQVLVAQPGGAWSWQFVNIKGEVAFGGLAYMSVLFACGAAAYVAAAAIFARRDLPAPL